MIAESYVVGDLLRLIVLGNHKQIYCESQDDQSPSPYT